MLNIITPVSRPQFLEIIYHSIESTVTIPWKWYTVIDSIVVKEIIEPLSNNHIVEYCNKKVNNFTDWGNSCRNVGLDLVKDGWVYNLDDDNILHPNFNNAMLNALNYYPQHVGYTFIQEFPNRKVRSVPFQHQPQHLDTAAFIFRRDAIADLRFDPTVRLCDKQFYNDMYDKYWPCIAHISDAACYYDFLKIRGECLD